MTKLVDNILLKTDKNNKHNNIRDMKKLIDKMLKKI